MELPPSILQGIAALEELVACHDLKKRSARAMAPERGRANPELSQRLDRELRRRGPLAWNDARDALAALRKADVLDVEPKPEDGAVAMCLSCVACFKVAGVRPLRAPLCAVCKSAGCPRARDHRYACTGDEKSTPHGLSRTWPDNEA
jgi:hypothetical protein